MNKYNDADIAGCKYTMEVLEQYAQNPIEWEHTSISRNDEYCKYDMDWTAVAHNGLTYHYAVENKDRRVNWKTKVPQFYSTYPSVMFNIEKYKELMEISNTEGKIPLYTADYTDGVVVFDLRKFPTDCTEIWKEKRNIGKNSVENGEKIMQERMMIPKEYGKFYKK